jgi:hypothetical protein
MERPARPGQMLLADKILEALGSHAVRERCPTCRARRWAAQRSCRAH